MKVMKLTFAIIALTMALTLILTAKNSGPSPPPPPPPPPSKPAALRVSRFLQRKESNPRAADHCHKDYEICHNTLDNGRNATCCNNKCFDLGYDNDHCGSCKKKCDFTETCCRGECVSVVFDKRHCGECNHRCMEGGYCIFGMCDYA